MNVLGKQSLFLDCCQMRIQHCHVKKLLAPIASWLSFSIPVNGYFPLSEATKLNSKEMIFPCGLHEVVSGYFSQTGQASNDHDAKLDFS